MHQYRTPRLSRFFPTWFCKNNKPAVKVNVSKLKSSQMESLTSLQNHVGKKNLAIYNSQFSKCYAQHMYKHVREVNNVLEVTFGGK